MKIHPLIRFLTFMLLEFMLLASCNTGGNLKLSETSTQTDMPAQETTPVVTRTSTTLPSSTSTITVTSIPPTSTAAPNPKTPLPESEQVRIVSELFKQDDNCRFPCFWNVVPGETPWEEVKQRIWDIGGSFGTFYKGKTTIYGLGGGLDSLLIEFYVNDGIVTYIHVESEGYQNMIHFRKLMDYYTPQNIMNNYGIPGRVWLATVNRSRGDVHGYQMWLVYDDYGFIVEYGGYLEERENDLRWCPRFKNWEDIDSVKIFMQEIDNSEPVETIAGLNDPEYLKERKRSLGESTRLTTEEFYNLFQPGGEGCFVTPNDIWEY